MGARTSTLNPAVDIDYEVGLKPFNTLAVDAQAAALARVDEASALTQVTQWAQRENLPMRLLGQGSNTVVSDWPGLLVQLQLRGIEAIGGDEQCVLVRAAAGEDWPELVRTTLDNGWYGLENLALIPGSVGAAPVQNIGAYGVELGDFLHAVEIYDLQRGEFKTIQSSELQLGYRSSALKQRPHWWVLALQLKLLREPLPVIGYAALREELQQKLGNDLQLVDSEAVYECVCALRRRRLPDTTRYPNAGSFFHNPQVTAQCCNTLLEQHPDMPVKAMGSDEFRLSAGWLLEHSGWRGKRSGALEMWREHALTLVNHAGGGSSAEITAWAREIQASVAAQMGVNLEVEPCIWTTQE